MRPEVMCVLGSDKKWGGHFNAGVCKNSPGGGTAYVLKLRRSWQFNKRTIKHTHRNLLAFLIFIKTLFRTVCLYRGRFKRTVVMCS